LRVGDDFLIESTTTTNQQQQQQLHEKDKRRFDLIIIGTGVAATTAAYKCRSAGWSVAIIDSRPFGGTCALRGCDPKKVLVGAAEVIDMGQRMKGKGIIIGDSSSSVDGVTAASINWHELMQFKRSFTEPVPKSREKAFQEAGIAAFPGSARFIGPTAIGVENKNNNKTNYMFLEGGHILIATGAEPMRLNFPGEEYLTKSDEFLELDELPDRIVFVGGGYISFEFAHIAARAGVKKAITIIHRGSRPLEKFDPDLVNMLVERTRKLGVDIMLQTEVKSIEEKKSPTSSSASKKFVVNTMARDDRTGEKRKEQQQAIDADMVVHGAGRIPQMEDLGLENAHVEYEKRGVKVNEYLQSISNPAVYAAGDCASNGGLPLTPVGVYDGQIAADNLLNGNNNKAAVADYNGTPSVVFTLPPLASVGLVEEDARKMGLKFKLNHSITSGWYSSRRINESHSGFKVLLEEGTDKILGAHLLGPHAEEVINIFAMAIRLGLTASDLRKCIWSYPTNTSDVTYML
jgi:glutathione reductase (NADPH)